MYVYICTSIYICVNILYVYICEEDFYWWCRLFAESKERVEGGGNQHTSLVIYPGVVYHVVL